MQPAVSRADEMIIDPARVQDDGQGTTISYTVRWGDQKRDVWFKVNGATAAATGNTAITLGLLAAMRTSRAIRIADPVSPKLLESQKQIQDVLTVWDHHFEHVDVTAPRLDATQLRIGSGVATFFSGGIDSFFTLLKRQDEITHLVFVHGFDIPLSKADLAERVTGELRGIAAEFNKPLVIVQTNLREFLDEFGDWGEDTHGAALAAVGHLLQPSMSKIYISSSHPYTALFRWGSHPLLDPQWSTETLEFDHFATAAPRAAKAAYVIENPVVQRTLRVCWQNPEDAYNCGTCGKCTRTMMYLKAAGGLEKAQTFRKPLTVEAIRNMRINSLSLATFTMEILRAIEARGGMAEIEEAIKHALGWWHKRLSEAEKQSTLAELPRVDQMQVGPGHQKADAGATTISYPIQWGNQNQEVWFKVQGAEAAPSGNAALAMSLVPAMRVAKKLRLPGSASPKLVGQLPGVQEIFAAWSKAFREVPIESTAVDQTAIRSGGGVGVFFSGGVDSFFTLLRHLDEVTHLIFVQGFDIKLKKQELADEVLPVIQTIAKELNKKLIVVTTNLRDFSDPLARWGEDYHGTALIAVAHLLQPTLRKVYISSTHSYADMFAWGSHPLLDYRWSTENLTIEHDGCDATRVKKVGAIAHHPTVQRTLRVCYRNKDGAYNCGLCEKCLRTMINLRVAGALEKCQTFERPLRLGEVRLIKVRDDNTAAFVSENLRAVEAKGDDPKLAQALREALSRRYNRGLGRIARVLLDLNNRLQRKLGK